MWKKKISTKSAPWWLMLFGACCSKQLHDVVTVMKLSTTYYDYYHLSLLHALHNSLLQHLPIHILLLSTSTAFHNFNMGGFWEVASGTFLDIPRGSHQIPGTKNQSIHLRHSIDHSQPVYSWMVVLIPQAFWTTQYVLHKHPNMKVQVWPNKPHHTTLFLLKHWRINSQLW